MPGEKMECKYPLKEVSQHLQYGDIYLSNFKIFFKPNGVKVEDCQRYVIPYGYISKLQENSNSEKTSGTITVTCKDERSLKFKLEGSAAVFINCLKIMQKHSQQAKLEYLFCSQWQSTTMLNWRLVKRNVMSDFERLGISKRFR